MLSPEEAGACVCEAGFCVSKQVCGRDCEDAQKALGAQESAPASRLETSAGVSWTKQYFN